MCGRAACSLAPDVVHQSMSTNGKWIDKEKYKPGYNLSAGSFLPVMVLNCDGEREIQTMCWGFPMTQGNNLILNGRAETLESKPTFKRLLNNRRCVVLTDGYYEWAKIKTSTGSIRKQPYFFRFPNNRILTMAGLFDIVGTRENRRWTFTVLTVAPLDEMAWIHDRMPALLDDASIDTWLNPQTPLPVALSLLKPFQGALEYYTVSDRVNYVANDSPDLIQRLPEMKSPSPRKPQLAQPKLDSFLQPLPEDAKLQSPKRKYEDTSHQRTPQKQPSSQPLSPATKRVKTEGGGQPIKLELKKEDKVSPSPILKGEKQEEVKKEEGQEEMKQEEEEEKEATTTTDTELNAADISWEDFDDFPYYLVPDPVDNVQNGQ